MLNCIYRLVAPHMIEPVVSVVNPGENDILVRPTYLSICNADQRYYQGKRSAHAMAQKLPMALIHEGVGEVLHDPSGLCAPGTPVVMLPNAPLETHEVISENYLRSSHFAGSGFDGFMQEIVCLNNQRILPLPALDDISLLAFTELVSVAVHAVKRFDKIAHEKRDVIGVSGDGNVGYIVSLVLHTVFSDSHIYIFGRNGYKLNDFTFADKVFLTSDIPRELRVDHAFECCGGEGSAHAIDQIIDYCHPEATVSLLGVSENPIPINTRMILEKGMRIFGSSRSGRDDFISTLTLFEQHPELVEYLSSLINRIIPVSSIADIAHAFNVDNRKPMGKTIMEWKM